MLSFHYHPQEPVSFGKGSGPKHLYRGHNKNLHNIFEAMVSYEQTKEGRKEER